MTWWPTHLGKKAMRIKTWLRVMMQRSCHSNGSWSVPSMKKFANPLVEIGERWMFMMRFDELYLEVFSLEYEVSHQRTSECNPPSTQWCWFFAQEIPVIWQNANHVLKSFVSVFVKNYRQDSLQFYRSLRFHYGTSDDVNFYFGWKVLFSKTSRVLNLPSRARGSFKEVITRHMHVGENYSILNSGTENIRRRKVRFYTLLELEWRKMLTISNLVLSCLSNVCKNETFYPFRTK